MSNETEQLKQFAHQIRRDVIRMVTNAGAGHPGGAMGAAEIFAVLYGHDMNHGPDKLDDPDRDRIILSNGHICAGWYSALARTGYMDAEVLATHRKMGSRLQGHPSREKWPEVVENSSGPLGQGTSVANGLALALRLSGSKGRVYCIVGDGELHEGIVWESVLTAAHYGLGNVTLIVADNDVQIDGRVCEIKKVRPLGPKFESFGWNVIELDGHDIPALIVGFDAARAEKSKPTAIIARTVIGKGMKLFENSAAAHGSCPTREQAREALEELGPATGYADFPLPQEAGL